MNLIRTCIALLAPLLTSSFQYISLHRHRGTAHHPFQRPHRSASRLFAEQRQQPQQQQMFDISKPVFDLYSLRRIRGDALAKYNSLNQSEPLRINLSLLLALILFSSPLVAQDLSGRDLTLPQTGGAILGGIGSTALFVRECQRRNRQLVRLEKELGSLSLPLKRPNSVFADRAVGSKAQTVRQVLQESSCRIVALSGNAQDVRAALAGLQVLGRRLVQANTLVVVAATDGSTRKDWGLLSERPQWLADTGDNQAWLDYFDSLRENQTGFRWFGLSPSGRSIGSGTDPGVSWLQLLGQHLRPVEVLDEDDPFQQDREGILKEMTEFYKALTHGDLQGIQSVYQSASDEAVTEVMKAGGRLDTWSVCLQEGNRPAGMKVADADCILVSDNEAWSTVIEFPALVQDATLLAVQNWKRDSSGQNWKLVKHQTIPWTGRAAAGTLICDCRGCVSLTRGSDRRTFGGIIG